MLEYPPRSNDYFFARRSLAAEACGADREFQGDRAARTIYTPLPAFARMARDTVMRRANRRVGEMGDNRHEEAHSGRRTAHARRPGNPRPRHGGDERCCGA